MKYLKLFEEYADQPHDLIPVGITSKDMNLIYDMLRVRKPWSWDDVASKSVDFEDFSDDELKVLFKLPIYDVNEKNIEELFDLQDVVYPENLDITEGSWIFYAGLKNNYQFFVVRFSMNGLDYGLLVDTQGFSYMRYITLIKNFSDLYDYYKKDISLREHYDYIDSLILLNEGIISEDKIKEIWSKIVNRVKGLPESAKRKIVAYGIASLIALGSIATITNVINKYQTEDVVIKDAVDQAISNFKDPTKLKVSNQGREHIKDHEKIKLVAYTIGDGKITVGYGHAEPSNKSKYRVGQKISKEHAEKLFRNDLKLAADGVRRIFAEWKKKGIERKVTQDQFDALVSMALNQGVSSLRQSEVIRYLKRGDYKIAGEKIKTQATSDKYPGLKSRREVESELFLSYLDDESSSTKL